MVKIRKPRTLKYPNLYITEVSDSMNERWKEIHNLAQEALQWIGIDNRAESESTSQVTRYKGVYENIKYTWYTNMETYKYKDFEVIGCYIGNSIKCIAFKKPNWGSYIAFPAYFKESTRSKAKNLKVCHISTNLDAIGVICTTETFNAIKQFFTSTFYKNVFESAEVVDTRVAKMRDKRIADRREIYLANQRVLLETARQLEKEAIKKKKESEEFNMNRRNNIISPVNGIIPPNPGIPIGNTSMYIPPLLLTVSNVTDKRSTLPKFQSPYSTGNQTVLNLLLNASYELYVFNKTTHILTREDIQLYLMQYLQYTKTEFETKLILNFFKEAYQNYILGGEENDN